MLILYGTDGCHLCHDAQSLLKQLRLTWQDVDIVDDDALMGIYATLIPVLKFKERELCWPFTREDVRHLLADVHDQ